MRGARTLSAFFVPCSRQDGAAQRRGVYRFAAHNPAHPESPLGLKAAVNCSAIGLRQKASSICCRGSRSLLRNIQKVGYPHQIGQRSRAELLHDVVTVNLDGDFTYADLASDPLIHQA